MKAEPVPGANAEFRAPADWDEEGYGPAQPQYILFDGTKILSQWRPSPEELKALFAGAPIHLITFGETVHPTIMRVGPVPSIQAMKRGLKDN